MTSPAWEEWLSGRFAGFLLPDAGGGSRSPEHVREALARLTGRPGALSTLAELSFLLDPELGTQELILDLVPRLLRHVYPQTHRVVDERRGSARGRIDWARTLELRMRTRDRSWFTGVSPKRSFATPELLLIRFLLERVLSCIAGLARGVLDPKPGWQGDLAALHTAATGARAHAAMRDLPVTRPTGDQRRACAQSRDPIVRAAVRVVANHDRLLPDPDALEATVARFALAPLDVNKRFELYVLLRVMDVLDGELRGFQREDDLIQTRRSAVARWELPGGTLSLFYDQSPEAGLHADVTQHYLGNSGAVRPDVRLAFQTPSGTRELYLDAKNSVKMSYLTHSHLKMLGYVADAPTRFVEPGPKVILVTPREVVGEPRLEDAVSYVAAEDCGAEGRLRGLLGTWLERARAHVIDVGPSEGAVAFMPWVTIEEPMELAGVRLVPFQRHAADQPEAVRDVLEAYRNGALPVESAILIEVEGSTAGALDEETRRALFEVRDLLCFVALRHRQFFGSGTPHWNSSAFELIVQQYRAEQGGSFIVPRTRGAPRGVFFAPEVHAVRAPPHVNAGQALDRDEPLLRALVAARTRDEWQWLEPFLQKLHGASTDSPALSEHTELVELVGAMQQVVGVPNEHKEPKITRAFLDLMKAGSPESRTTSDCQRPPLATTFQGETSLRTSWLKDFYRSRGAVAHGDTTPRRIGVWSVSDHLLLASYVLPRLALVRLASAGLYELSGHDRDEIGAFDYLLCLEDLCARYDDGGSGRRPWAWNQALAEGYRDARIDRITRGK